MPIDENWISSGEASRIMTERHGRPIRVSYINILARNGFIRRQPFDGHANLLYRPDVEAYHIRQRPPKGQGRWKTYRSQKQAMAGAETAVV